ncbi:hypothetical protein AAFF_G00249520 [Aldrovandia affinis]|uniref:Sushi domain-containing protein n=1 Tax=Aldrovandia affinis TaxID=143900 RepID=A0AAD7W3X9_9TELE|nr:hypothetical protein AAFF_G00249520 [Aldrovandia affinis]
MNCKNGQWTTSARYGCDPKQCGHPGDLLYGDFTLTRGEDFVFGSEIQYTCQRGYTLAGKINHRSCMAQGWDNAVPFCEVVKCEPIQPTEDFIASGNTEQPKYGDVIQFECKADNKLDGTEQIHCTDTGKWSESLPKCVEIVCESPEIPHGSTTSPTTKVYKKNEILSFACEKGYMPVGRPSSICTKDDWSPKPQCEEIVCKVPQLADIHPKTKNVFYPGEPALIKCGLGFRTSTKKLQDTALCQSDGSWSISTFCEEITCSVTVMDNIHPYYYRQSYRNGEKLSHHSCRTGFKESEYSTCRIEGWVPPLCQAITCDPMIPNARLLSEDRKYTLGQRLEYECNAFHTPEGKQEAICRVNGWKEKPLCTPKPSFCTRPDVDNGYLIPDKTNYEDASVIRYACDPGYKPLLEAWWGELTCNNNRWSHIPNCIDAAYCVPPTIAHAEVKDARDMYSHGEVVKFECVQEYNFKSKDNIRCVNGNWETPLPICETTGKMCPPLTRVEDAVITSKYKREYDHRSKVQYQCKELYKPDGKEVECINGIWNSIPKCTLSICTSPKEKVNDAVLVSKKEKLYENESSVHYRCEATTFAAEGVTTALCINGVWQYPHCIKKDYCEIPRLSHGIVLTSQEKVMEGETLDYMCFSPYKKKHEGNVTCKDAQWDEPVECTSTNAPCSNPPGVNDGDIHERKYENGELREVTYKCQKYFTLKDKTPVTCQMGNWTPSPVCLAPCEIKTIDAMYNLKDPKDIIYVPEGESVKLYCKFSYHAGVDFWRRWIDEVEVKCQSGNINYHRCVGPH